MNVTLLTGYRGLIGSALLNHLSADPEFQLIVVGGATDKELDIPIGVEWLSSQSISEGILFGRKIDTVINCANTYENTLFSTNSPIRVNLEFPLFLVESLQNSDAHFVNLDTSLNKSPDYYHARLYYSLSKKHLKEYLRIYADTHLVSNVICEHVYGPGSLSRSTLISDLVLSGLSGNLSNLTISPGRQMRDFIYVDDIASAILHIIKHRNRANLGNYADFEVGSGTAISFLDLGSIIQKKLNLEFPFPFGSRPYRELEIMHSVANLTLMKSLGWEPKIDLSQGLDRLINFAKLYDSNQSQSSQMQELL